MVSCQKEPVLEQEEGLMSNTGDQELQIYAGQQSGEAEVYHKRYDRSVTAEEANTLWDADVKDYIKSSNLKGTSKTIAHRICS